MPQQLERLVFYVQGTLIAFATSIQAANQNNNSDGMTILGGFVGSTPHGGKTVLNVTVLVPEGGEEFDFHSAEVSNAYFDVAWQRASGGQKKTMKAQFRNVSEGVQVGNNTEISFELHGPTAEVSGNLI